MTPTTPSAPSAAGTDRTSYVDRDGFDAEYGYEIEVTRAGNRVSIALGETRRTLAFSPDAWAELTIAEARELAGDLNHLANEAEIHARKEAR